MAELGRIVGASPLTAGAAAALAEDLTGQLLERIRALCVRTLVTDLHEYRERSLLEGADSRARYAHFERIIASRSYADSLTERYPGLLPELHRAAERFVRNLESLLSATEERLPDLRREFGLGADASITGVQTGKGDAHRGGKSVSVLEFSGGTRIVYKPRPMEVERAYHELARRMHAESGLPVGSLKVVPGRGCGWEEYAAPEAVHDAAGVAGFYRNTGVLLCLLHFLRAMDVHFQNIVRRGSVPYLLDAETLLAVNASADEDEHADNRAKDALSRSVKMVGLLPSVIENSRNESGVMDVGLLGYTQGQTSPFKSLVVVDSGRDTMRLELRNLPVGDSEPVPRLETPEEEITMVVDGFEAAYDWISGRRHDFSRWVSELFGNVTVRFVAENTYFYTQLLRMGTHPRLQDGTNAKRTLFHRVGIGRPHTPAPVLRAEIEDLVAGDVPYFALSTRGTEIYDSRGHRLGSYLKQTPIDSARELIESSSAADRRLNASIIRLSYVSKLRHASDRTGFVFDPKPGTGASAGAADARDARETVGRIASEIVHQRIEGSGTLPPTWIGARISPTALQYWQVDELGTDFYSGSPGLAYFLGQAGTALGREEWTESALQYFTRLGGKLVERGIQDVPNLLPGMYTGAGGIAYAMHNLADTVGDTGLHGLAARIWNLIPGALPDEAEFDVLGGASGLLGASLALAERSRGTEHESHYRAAAAAFYERIRRAVEDLRARPDATYYSGFAHGVSGVYPYLLRYGAQTGDPVCADLVESLLDRERRLFDAGTGTWAIGGGADQSAHGWCHGAPGMLLAKCLAATFQPDLSDRFLPEIRILLDTVLRESFGHNLTLCHGDLGNLQIVGFAAEVLDDRDLRERADRRMDEFAARTVPALLRSEGNRHVLAESVMAGRAGIGLTLLRRMNPDAVPPVLWFLR
ncbi:type 2 lanthipeptide synthetase LanM [Streptomonospora wellingtoniae]|uniref:Type 2 lanthipeptide synthetase LanM n=1 Tax=Streptomonospora wellingtoniae TaxID=3075544 RepID=A0ABU2KVV0_9ACTN|nr:type 2 lanthipeptide synthetase LanM [Streptomonospora sp. DSM 45055]MDT0303424.1 type 2 lanthipeptide synthetase LanM [Streptomonospora sp. DSM 45055]